MRWRKLLHSLYPACAQLCCFPLGLHPTRTSSPPLSEATTNHFMFQVEMFCARFSGRARKWRLFAVALGQTCFRWKLFSFTVFLSEKTSLSLFLFSVGFKVPGLSCGAAACQWAGVALPGTASPSPTSPTETLQLPGPRAPALLSLLLHYSSCCKEKQPKRLFQSSLQGRAAHLMLLHKARSKFVCRGAGWGGLGGSGGSSSRLGAWSGAFAAHGRGWGRRSQRQHFGF